MCCATLSLQQSLLSCQAGSEMLPGAGKPGCRQHAGPGDAAGGRLQGGRAVVRIEPAVGGGSIVSLLGAAERSW